MASRHSPLRFHGGVACIEKHPLAERCGLTCTGFKSPSVFSFGSQASCWQRTLQPGSHRWSPSAEQDDRTRSRHDIAITNLRAEVTHKAADGRWGESCAVQRLLPPFARGSALGKQRQIISTDGGPRHVSGVFVCPVPGLQLNGRSIKKRSTDWAMAALSPNGTSNPRPSASTSSAYR